MNPAPSIVFFTTASGAGYGLIFWLGLLRPLGLVPEERGFGVIALGIGVVLVCVGLLASLAHLGRPERAWRALSQWRSSWLSREGVAAIASFPAFGLFGLAMLLGWGGLAGFAGLLAAAGALVTVWCTGMIYASLKPIRQWHHPLVLPGYLLIAAFSGALLLAMTAAYWGGGVTAALVAALSAGGGLLLKRAYWQAIDAPRPAEAPSIESATGLGRIGATRPLDPPHTEQNWLLREMGFRLARKHAERLRLFALAAGFMVPGGLALVALFSSIAGSDAVAVVLLSFAVSAATLGLLAERWLLFAQATHTVTLYYTGE